MNLLRIILRYFGLTVAIILAIWFLFSGSGSVINRIEIKV